ncbi:MAG: AraC family transcriptional regulator [Armatimonas sp.]
MPVSGSAILGEVHLRLLKIDALELPAGTWTARNVCDPFWRLYRNESDGAFLSLPNREPFLLHAGRVYLVPAGVFFSCGQTAAFEHFYLHFDVVGLPRLTLASLFDGPVELPKDMEFEERVSTLSKITEPNAQRWRAKAIAYEALARHIETVPDVLRARALGRAAALEPVAPALALIESSPNSDLDVPTLARACCFSTDHFARLFKSGVGQSPAIYVQSRRIERAAERLLTTSDSLERIAEDCGLGNRFYLSRVFTRKMGVSPATYRRQGMV